MQPHPQQHRPAPPMSTATLQHPGKIQTPEQLTQHLHNTGSQHYPIWLHKSALHHVAPLIASGHAIPHPGIPIPMPDPAQQQQPPQGYAQGGEIQPKPFIQPPQFLGPPAPANGMPPQRIDNGAVGMQRPPMQQGFGNLRVPPQMPARVPPIPRNAMAKGGVVKNDTEDDGIKPPRIAAKKGAPKKGKK